MINSLILDPVSVFLTVIIIQNSITTVASWAQAIVVVCIGFCTVVLALFCPLPCASLVESATYPMSTYDDAREPDRQHISVSGLRPHGSVRIDAVISTNQKIMGCVALHI